MILNDETYIYTKRTFGTWQFGKIGVLVNFIIKEWKFCKIAQFFLCVHKFLWPERNLRRLRKIQPLTKLIFLKHVLFPCSLLSGSTIIAKI
jgi:hypothetical protein